MSLSMPERLYRLLPAIHRLRDAAEGETLRALLAVVESELERIEADTAALYDNWFIETCDEWVVPYIGDLLGVRPIRPVANAGVSARAYVANTIAYRRRKGTALVLEQLARDVTGWPSHAVEFFQRLATTQHMNHVRGAPAFTASVRDAARAELADGPFDPFAHGAEARRIATQGGRFAIPNVGLFVWRLRSYSLGSGTPGDEAADFTSARRLGDWWSVHPAGVDAPLFNRPRTETAITELAREEHVPGRLRRLALHAELERLRLGIADPAPRFMTSDAPVLRVFVQLVGEPAPVEVRREDIYLCELPDALESASPAPRALALDPLRGRIAFPGALAVERVWVHGSHGFAGDLGGGPYDRSAAVRAANAAIDVAPTAAAASGGFDDPSVWQVGVSHLVADDGSGTLFASLRAAVEAWNVQPAGRTGVIVLMDSLSEIDQGASPSTPVEIELRERSRLLVVAGTWAPEPVPGAPPGSVRRRAGQFEARDRRAHFVGDLRVRGSAPEASPDGGACWFNGLMLEGQLVVAPGNLAQLDFEHGTLVPGHGGLLVQAGGNPRLAIRIERAICAGITVAGPLAGLTVTDTIVDDGDASPALGLDAPHCEASLLRSSFLGSVAVQQIEASDCIFAGGLQVGRRQSGCVRFSFLPRGASAPRQYRCQPGFEAAAQVAALRERARGSGRVPTATEEAAVRADAEARIRPLFVSRRFGNPGYGQLQDRCAVQIREGAESGAEMGAFEFLRQAQREANLRDALDEYLRFGLEAGIFHVT